MGVCTNRACKLEGRPQFGRSTCMMCKAELPPDKPLTGSQGSGTTSGTGELAAASDQDWIDAARWLVASQYPEHRVKFKKPSTSDCRELVTSFHKTMIGEDPDGDDVRGYAKYARDKAEALALIDGWASLVVRSLPAMGQTAALPKSVRSTWQSFSQPIGSAMNDMDQQSDIYTGQATAGGGSMICISFTLLDDVDALRFSLAHETGHAADIALRRKSSTELQMAIRGKDSYAPKPTGDHEMEFFADGFAALLLMAAGKGKNEVANAATTLFKGSSVTSEHPSGSSRIDNINSVASREFSKD